MGLPSLGGGIVRRISFYNSTTGREGFQYNVTLAYATGDLAALSVVASDLSGIGVSTTVTEVKAHIMLMYWVGTKRHDFAAIMKE